VKDVYYAHFRAYEQVTVKGRREVEQHSFHTVWTDVLSELDYRRDINDLFRSHNEIRNSLNFPNLFRLNRSLLSVSIGCLKPLIIVINYIVKSKYRIEFSQYLHTKSQEFRYNP